MANVGRIMVVDDDHDILSIIEMALQEHGFSIVDAFSDARQALNHFKSQTFESESDYTLVLTDVRMPGMTGVELASELLKLNSNQRIVFMTAFEEQYLQSVGSSLPSSASQMGCLQKPFTIAQLLQTIKAIVST